MSKFLYVQFGCYQSFGHQNLNLDSGTDHATQELGHHTFSCHFCCCILKFRWF